MRHHFRVVTGVLLVCAALVGSAATAAAQYRPSGEAAVGERYHIEAAGVLWNPKPDVVISSESLGIPGDDVDLVNDLGIEQKRFPELRLVLRPAPKHKFRFDYTPIKYEAESQVRREFVFNGQRYRVGLPVSTLADLRTLRVGYEYDFLYMDRGYVGFLIDAKYTNVDVTLNSPIGEEFVRSAAPIPTIGLTGRGYVTPNVSITGEFTYFRVPKSLGGEDFGGRYFDLDIYGTANFTEYVGVQFGYRKIDVNYFADLDAGTLVFNGLFFGGVVRY